MELIAKKKIHTHIHINGECLRTLTYTKVQNQNQNCYWWHVQMTIIHQDLWWGKLVSSPYFTLYQRNSLSANHSRWNVLPSFWEALLYMSHDMTKPTKWVFAQQRLGSVWASALSDQSLRCPHEETLGPYLPNERRVKTLIRLGGCPGWSESSLGTHSFCWFCHVAAHIYLARLFKIFKSSCITN